MNEFKIGRRVKVVNSSFPTCSIYVGLKGRIREPAFDTGSHWSVDLENGRLVTWHDSELELLPDDEPEAMPQPAVDLINTPSHYLAGGIECIDAIEAALTPEEFRGFLKGNVLKYVWRERHKGGAESLKKAAWYLARLNGETKP